jgi:hypothetical protein
LKKIADTTYEAALREAGFFNGGPGPGAVAACIRASNVNPAVTDALYARPRRRAAVHGRTAAAATRHAGATSAA